MRTHRFVTVLSALLFGCAIANADTPRDTLVVSSKWLAEHQQDANLVLLHVGDKAEYDARHIPGARFLSLREISAPTPTPGNLTLEMSAPAVLRGQLEALGISDTSRIVIYYGTDWVSPTTRAVFTMLNAGLGNVSMLDGGMGAWVKDGHEVTAAVPPARKGTLSALTMKPMIVDAEFVQSHTPKPGFAIVDARTPEFYSGSQIGGPADHRKAGHIADALSVPFSQMFNDDNTLRSNEELAQVFRKAGVKDGDTVVAYCHIGQQATATIFGALLLGHPVQLYDGSFEDWARRELPVQTGSPK